MTEHPQFFRKAKSKVIQEELEKLVDSKGKLDPEVVVKVARRKAHPLHGYFEWDDKKAAHAHRIDQARALIREVKVEVRTSVTQVTAVSYVRDPSSLSRQRGYVALHTIPTASDRAREVIRQEMVRVEGALSRARAVAVAVGLEDDQDIMIRAAALINGRI
jgi:hypothetical protein